MLLRTRIRLIALSSFCVACGGANEPDPVGPIGREPANLAVLAGDAQEGIAESMLRQFLVAKVVDDRETPVQGVAVTWTVTAGGGTLSPQSPTSGVDGIVTASWRMGAVGPQRTSATLVGKPALTVSFSATAVQRRPRVTKESGDAQTGFVGRPLPADLRVIVRDQYDDPVAGLPVLWTVATGSGSVSTAESPTDASGQASVQWTVGLGSGNQTLQAGISGGPMITFSATAVSTGGGRFAVVHGSTEIFDADLFTVAPDGTQLKRMTTGMLSAQEPSWSEDGKKVAFVRCCLGNLAEIATMNADGTDVRVIKSEPVANLVGSPRWSPDGTEIVFVRKVAELNQDVFVMRSDGGDMRRLTDSPVHEFYPRWSPDGTKIAFQTLRDGNSEIYVMNRDGSQQTNLTNHPGPDGSPFWSPDGRTISFRRTGERSTDIYAMNADGSNVRRITSNDPGIGSEPGEWSPDGFRMAFRSNRTGKYENYTMNPDGTGVMQITRAPAGMFFGELAWGRIP
jgi:Tol biopolymer transport system component